VGAGARWLLLLGFHATAACGAGSVDARPSAQPAGWDDELALVSLPDTDPADGVVAVSLDARVARVELAPGQEVEAWTYAGVTPGPVIRAKVGDTLAVHFENHLPEPTTIHWHGLEVPADQDGAGHASDVIAPGASFDYRFALKHAGTFWYHPHLNSAEQVWRGLYGALIVEDPSEPALGDELTLVLHDVNVDEETSALGPAADQGDLGRFFGHEGRTLLVNGRIAPTLRAYAGSALRLRLINAAISRYYRFAVEGHALTRVGGDSGLIAQPEQVDDVLLAPGQRSEVVLALKAAAGARIALRTLPYSRFECGADCSPARDLMHVEVVEGRGRTRAVPAALARIEPLDASAARDRVITLDQVEQGTKTFLAVNGRVHGQDDLVLEAKVGTIERWTVRNETEYDHPFHLHGFRFQVLTQQGLPRALLEWQDTVNVPAMSDLRFIVSFDDRPGMWMFHCHILDHTDLGMMAMLHLEH
jgi:FtsP/CotA-like multicopper oxidase with cupredoxin domain